MEYGQVDYEENEDIAEENNEEYERAADSDVVSSKWLVNNRQKEKIKTTCLSSVVEVNVSDDSIIKAEEEIAKELVVAQKEYNRLTTYRPVPRLRKPSVYIPCKQAKMNKKVAEIEEPLPPVPSEHDINVSVEVKLTTNYDESCGKMVQKICECIVKFQERKLQEQPPRIEEIMPARDRGDSNIRTEGQIDGEYEEMGEAEQVKVYKPLEPIDLPSLPEIDAGKNVTIRRKPSPRCKCKYRVRKKLRTQSCNCEKCQELNKQPPTFIIAGLTQAEDQDPVPIIESVKDETCDCMFHYKQRIKRYEEYKTRHDMVEQMRSLSQKFVITGVSIGTGGEPVFTISGKQFFSISKR